MVDKIEVTKSGTVQVRKVIFDADGKPTYQRYILTPGSDLVGEDSQVRQTANAAWTEEVIKKYKAKIKRNNETAV